MTEQNGHLKDDQLQAYLDDVLEPTIAKEIQFHLETCSACREELARLKAVSYQLEKLPEASLSRDLSRLVVSQLEGEQSLSPAITWTLVIEALAAGAVIAVLIPALQAAGWLPRLLEIRLGLGAGLKVFLAQLASNWLVWWAGLRLQLNQLITSFNPLGALPLEVFSPWLIIGVAGGLVVLINALLLGGQSLPNSNHKGSQF